MRRIAVAAIVSSLVVVLSGCASGAPSGGEDTQSSSPAEVEASSDAPAEAEYLVISAEGIQVVLSDGTDEVVFDYFQPVDEVTAGLSEVFGAEPEVSKYEPIASFGYDWGGFFLGTDGPGQDPAGAESHVRVTAAEVHGIGIHAVDGTRVGDPADPLEAAYPDSSRRWIYKGTERLDVGIAPVAIAPGDERIFSVDVTAFPADGAITQVAAPMKNFE